jgi:moderate conductance mechanosensitive channel
MRPIIALFTGLMLFNLFTAPTFAAGAVGLQHLQGSGQDASMALQPLVVPPDLRPEQVEAFVAPLSDRDARAVLLAELQAKTVAAAAASAADQPSSFASLIEQRRHTTAMLDDRLSGLKQAWHNLPEQLDFMVLLLSSETPLRKGLRNLAIMIAAGALAALVVYRLTRGVCTQWMTTSASSWPVRITVLSGRLMLDLASVLAFALFAFGTSFLLFNNFDPMRLFAEAYAGVVALVFFAWVVARFVFAPQAVSYRLMVMDDRTAIRATLLTVVMAAGYGLISFSMGLVELLGGGEEIKAILRLTVIGFVVVIATLHLLTARVNAPGHPILQAWPWLGLLVLAVAGLLWFLNSVLGEHAGNMATMVGFVLFLSVPTVDASLRSCLDPTVSGADTRRLLASGVRRLLITVQLLISGAMLAQGAGLPLFALLKTPIGAMVLGALVEVALTALVAVAIWTLLRDWIDRWIEREREIAEANASGAGMGEGEGGSAIIGTRAQTLLPLFRATILVFIIAVSVLVMLSSAGVDIGPLLAGAGVIGLAIGFGAQALVRDVVSGIFFLVDDAFRVGEYLEIGELRGEVEKISVRSMQLRHHRGMVQTIPFGELRHITNYSRDWVIYKQDFLVPFDTDIEKVRKMIKKLGQEMLSNPEIGHLFIEPMKSQGVTRIEEAGMVVRTKFTCKPRQQFTLRRYVNLNIQRLFMENGIQFARRRIQVESTSGEAVSGDAASAAQVVLEQEAARGV